MEVIRWQIKDKSVHIPVAIVQYKMEIRFAVINVENNLKVLENPVNAAIRAVAIITKNIQLRLKLFHINVKASAVLFSIIARP
jgi:hypothetical protein